MSRDAVAPPAVAGSRLVGWLEAGCFVAAITVLNLAYAMGHASGANPVAFLVWAMLTASLALLAITGPGPHWRAIMLHPMSWIVGGGIIGMEAAYFMLLRYVAPADASLLVRLNLPASVAIAWLVLGRVPRRGALWGIVLVVAGVVWYVGQLETTGRTVGVVLALACALVSSIRNFAAEHHPWNRSARTIMEKMRITGLVLLVTSATGTALVAALVGATQAGLIPPIPGIPDPSAFVHGPTVLLGGFMGLVVLTAMQYFGFSSVVKIGTENFIAANSFVPVTTLLLQVVAVAGGLIAPIAVPWQVFPVLAVVIAGVLIFIWSARVR